MLPILTLFLALYSDALAPRSYLPNTHTLDQNTLHLTSSEQPPHLSDSSEKQIPASFFEADSNSNPLTSPPATQTSEKIEQYTQFIKEGNSEFIQVAHLFNTDELRYLHEVAVRYRKKNIALCLENLIPFEFPPIDTDFIVCLVHTLADSFLSEPTSFLRRRAWINFILKYGYNNIDRISIFFQENLKTITDSFKPEDMYKVICFGFLITPPQLDDFSNLQPTYKQYLFLPFWTPFNPQTYPIHIFIETGNLEAIQTLKKETPFNKDLWGHINQNNMNALHLASSLGDVEILREILTQTNSKHSLPIPINQPNFKTHKSALYYAFQNNHPECAQLLLQHNASLPPFNTNKDLILLAIQNRSLPLVKLATEQLLKILSGEIPAPTNYIKTINKSLFLLYFDTACNEENSEIASYLLQSLFQDGYQLYHKKYQSLMVMAIESGQTQCFNILLHSGYAFKQACDCTAIYRLFARQTSLTPSKTTEMIDTLVEFLETNSTHAQKFLKQAGSLSNNRSSYLLHNHLRQNLLHFACYFADKKLVSIFLQSNLFSFLDSDHLYRNVFSYVLLSNDSEFILWFMKTYPVIIGVDKNRYTSLHYACLTQNLSVIKELFHIASKLPPPLTKEQKSDFNEVHPSDYTLEKLQKEKIQCDLVISNHALLVNSSLFHRCPYTERTSYFKHEHPNFLKTCFTVNNNNLFKTSLSSPETTQFLLDFIDAHYDLKTVQEILHNTLTYHIFPKKPDTEYIPKQSILLIFQHLFKVNAQIGIHLFKFSWFIYLSECDLTPFHNLIDKHTLAYYFANNMIDNNSFIHHMNPTTLNLLYELLICFKKQQGNPLIELMKQPGNFSFSNIDKVINIIHRIEKLALFDLRFLDLLEDWLTSNNYIKRTFFHCITADCTNNYIPIIYWKQLIEVIHKIDCRFNRNILYKLFSTQSTDWFSSSVLHELGELLKTSSNLLFGRRFPRLFDRIQRLTLDTEFSHKKEDLNFLFSALQQLLPSELLGQTTFEEVLLYRVYVHPDQFDIPFWKSSFTKFNQHAKSLLNKMILEGINKKNIQLFLNYFQQPFVFQNNKKVHILSYLLDQMPLLNLTPLLWSNLQEFEFIKNDFPSFYHQLYFDRTIFIKNKTTDTLQQMNLIELIFQIHSLQVEQYPPFFLEVLIQNNIHLNSYCHVLTSEKKQQIQKKIIEYILSEKQNFSNDSQAKPPFNLNTLPDIFWDEFKQGHIHLHEMNKEFAIQVSLLFVYPYFGPYISEIPTYPHETIFWSCFEFLINEGFYHQPPLHTLDLSYFRRIINDFLLHLINDPQREIFSFPLFFWKKMEETPIDLSSLDISDHRMEAIKREMRSKAHLKPLSSFQFHYLPFHGHFIFEDSQVEFNYDNKGHIVKLPPYEPAPYYSEQDEYPSLEEFTAEPVKFDLPAYEEVDPLSILMTQTSNKSLTHKRTLRQFLQGHKNSFSLRHLYLHSA